MSSNFPTNGCRIRSTPRVDYTLAEPGQALRATVDAMRAWTTRYPGDIEEARGRFDR